MSVAIVNNEETLSRVCGVDEIENVRWNSKIRKTVEVLGCNMNHGQELHVEVINRNLVAAKYGTYCMLLKDGSVIVDKCNSIETVENGWLVICKHGIYYLYNHEGVIYKGISFLKKANAIRFANTL